MWDGSDFILQRAREEFGPKVSVEDVFYYVYGLLHSEEYRKRFSSDLKKTLARIPLVASIQDFKAFVKAGRKLADLHLNYETGPLCQQLIITGDKPGKLNVTKMRFPSKEDKGTILFNDSVKIENIPMAAYDYVVSSHEERRFRHRKRSKPMERQSTLHSRPCESCDSDERRNAEDCRRVAQVGFQLAEVLNESGGKAAIRSRV